MPTATSLLALTSPLRVPDLQGGEFKVGQQLDVFDEHPAKRRWTEATVISVSDDHIRVHFKVRRQSSCASCAVGHGQALTKLLPAGRTMAQGFTSRFDEDISKTSQRLAPFGKNSRVKRVYRPVSKSYWHHRKRNRFISREDPRLVSITLFVL